MENDGSTQVHHNLAHELSRNWRFNKKSNTFNDLEKILVDENPKSVLITSENFENISQEKDTLEHLEGFFTRLGFDVRVLVVVRPQTGLLNSAYAEQIKRFLHRKTFAEAVGIALHRREERYDPNVAFRYWMKYFDVQFIPLSAEVMKSGLDRAFYRTMGLSEETLRRLRGGEPVNEAPGPKTIEAARTIRGILENLLGSDLKAKNIVGGLEIRRSLMKQSTKLGWNDTKFYGYDEGLFRRVEAHFSEANDRFSQRVFGQPWSEVFSERRKSKNVFRLKEASAREKTQFRGLVKDVIYSMHKP